MSLSINHNLRLSLAHGSLPVSSLLACSQCGVSAVNSCPWYKQTLSLTPRWGWVVVSTGAVDLSREGVRDGRGRANLATLVVWPGSFCVSCCHQCNQSTSFSWSHNSTSLSYSPQYHFIIFTTVPVYHIHHSTGFSLSPDYQFFFSIATTVSAYHCSHSISGFFFLLSPLYHFLFLLSPLSSSQYQLDRDKVEARSS